MNLYSSDYSFILYSCINICITHIYPTYHRSYKLTEYTIYIIWIIKKSKNSAKIDNLENTFTSQEITSLDIYYKNIRIRIQVKWEILSLNLSQVLALLLNLGHCGHFILASTFYTAFIRV